MSYHQIDSAARGFETGTTYDDSLEAKILYAARRETHEHDEKIINAMMSIVNEWLQSK